VNRGDVWLAEVGSKRRPVLVLTRSEVIDVRELVTVAEVTTSIRGLAVEVSVADEDLALKQPSMINCDGIHTVAQSSLTSYIGSVSEPTMERVCAAICYALGF
jgi:mRNA-degrading endonuclease toxin of MazEF toxin-antitoxin module